MAPKKPNIKKPEYPKEFTLYVLRETYPDGRFSFFTVYGFHAYTTGISIESMASTTEAETAYLIRNGVTRVSVSFTPPHDIECPRGLAPRLCVPLSKTEQKKFWKAFIKNREEVEPYRKFIHGENNNAVSGQKL